jgi:hypothetical protein
MLYCTLDISLLNDVDYTTVTQSSSSTVRQNNDNTLFIISFPKDKIPVIAEGEEHLTWSETYELTTDPSKGWVEE